MSFYRRSSSDNMSTLPDQPFSRPDSTPYDLPEPSIGRTSSTAHIGRRKSSVRIVAVNTAEEDMLNSRQADNLAQPRSFRHQNPSQIVKRTMEEMMMVQQQQQQQQRKMMLDSRRYPTLQGKMSMPLLQRRPTHLYQQNGGSVVVPAKEALPLPLWVMEARLMEQQQQQPRQQTPQAPWSQQAGVSGYPTETRQRRFTYNGPTALLNPRPPSPLQTSRTLPEYPLRPGVGQNSSTGNSQPEHTESRRRSSLLPSRPQGRRATYLSSTVVSPHEQKSVADLSLAQRLKNIFTITRTQHRRPATRKDRHENTTSTTDEELVSKKSSTHSLRSNVDEKKSSHAHSINGSRGDGADGERPPPRSATAQLQNGTEATSTRRLSATESQHAKELQQLDNLLRQREKRMSNGGIPRTTSFRGDLDSDSDIDDADDKEDSDATVPLNANLSNHSSSFAASETIPGVDMLSSPRNKHRDDSYSFMNSDSSSENAFEQLAPASTDSTLGSTTSFFREGNPDL